MKKLILASLIILGTTISLISCQEEENIQPNNTVQESHVLMSKEYSPAYYAGLKLRKIKGCSNSIGFCPSSKLQEATLDQYNSISVSDDLFRVKILPLSDNKINMNVIVSDGYLVEDIFEIEQNVNLPLPSYYNLQKIILNPGSYPITKIGDNEYSININAVIY
ncbi:hypothetical protein [Chryseobacterium sp. JM1]|uniref:hypothetical protein n=1 Tax=Chryseobacterium sp. JM1 TaxID=1233950 RepID=UPI0004E69DC7|nr:hypothetical protein [Chryseobacterium sp. JM1]KFF21266.1 hypothetical protein IW22_09745 [Chryseobacterium sp. JM1]